ncbi:MAG: hypothetical protein AAB486_03835 [Patescibacteria group bacterium]
MEDTSARLFQIILSSFFSFLNAGVYLFELFLVLKVVKEIRLDSYFRRVTPLVNFVLALLVTSLAFPTLNGFLTKYIGGLFGSGAPLAKILLLAEATVFVVVFWRLYQRGVRTGGKSLGAKPEKKEPEVVGTGEELDDINEAPVVSFKSKPLK